MRKIFIEGTEYQYFVGHTNVRIKNMKINKSRIVDFSILTGIDWYNIERGMHKKYFSIIPQQIKDYIIKEKI